MSPLTIYTSEGLPKIPAGPQGEAGVPGATGPAGPPGPVGPNRPHWYAMGDNTGDSAPNASTTVWATATSPVFTAPAAGWYRIRAVFNVLPGGGGTVTAAVALMVNAVAMRMLYTSVGQGGEYQIVSLQHVVQLAVGQQVKIGYRPVTAARNISLVNSNTNVPTIGIEEVPPPS